MRQLARQYGGCVYVTRKLRPHEKAAAARKEAEEAEAAAAARASATGRWLSHSAAVGCFSGRGLEGLRF